MPDAMGGDLRVARAHTWGGVPRRPRARTIGPMTSMKTILTTLLITLAAGPAAAAQAPAPQ
ncbi:MAG: hypothetical protein ACXVFN_01520, partial [Solirubrobacteraceae bacterium]